jgi:hypothetical protein
MNLYLDQDASSAVSAVVPAIVTVAVSLVILSLVMRVIVDLNASVDVTQLTCLPS